MLDVRRLRVLREVATHGSFSAAAEALSYTQSAVSQQIAALEREAGARLVERSARGVKLTDAGRVLVGHTDVILARLADAEEELQAINGLRAGRLRLAAFPSACATLMPLAVARFREHHPDVELSICPAEPEEGRALLRAGEVDIALSIDSTFALPRTDAADVETMALLDDPMYILLSRDHPLAGRRNLKLPDLAAEGWIIGTAATCPDTSIFLRACQVAGFEPYIVRNLDDYNAIQGFVAAGMGVSFIPDLALVNLRDDLVIRLFGRGRTLVRRISALTLADSYRSPAKRAMLDVLVKVSEEFGARRTELALAS
jgi:DNA-binding transcriptional LysR family regulator